MKNNVCVNEVPPFPKPAPPCKPPKKEMVNLPDHYVGRMVLDFIEALEATPGNNMSYFRSSAIKYIAQAGLKNPDKEKEDLEKAIQYLQFEIERIERD